MLCCVSDVVCPRRACGVRGVIRLVLLLAAVLGASRLTHAQATCATATSLVVGTTFVGNNSSSAGDGLFGLCATTSRSQWHFFTPAVTGHHTISLCGSNFDTVLSLHSGCSGSILACDDNTCGTASIIVAPLTAGTTYFLRIASQGSTPGGQYKLLVTAPAFTGPANENCASAATLAANTVVRSSNLGASGTDVSSCGLFDTTDVWFAFTPLSTGTHRVEVCATGFAPVVSRHNSCIGAQSAGCSLDGTVLSCSNTSAGLEFSANAGQQVLLRVAGQRGSFGSFDIAVYTPRPNDLCASAIPVVVNTPLDGSTTPIVGTEGEGACAASVRDVWHSFVPPATGVYTVATCGSSFDTVVSVHGACPTSTTPAPSLFCNDDFCSRQSSLNATMNAGQIYYIRVAGKNTATGWGNYTLLVSQQAPTNNLCDTPGVLALSTPTVGSTLAATGADLTGSCGLLDNKDVWYVFVPPATGAYELHTCNSVMDTTLSIFTSCFSTTPLTCNDNDPAFCGNASSASRIQANLNANTSYFVRVAASSNGEGIFSLTANRVIPANDTCATALPLTSGVLTAGTLTGASASTGHNACGQADAPDAWYTFTPSASRFYSFDTCGSVSELVLTLYPTCPPATPIACATRTPNACLGGPGTTLTAFLTSGTTYRLRVAKAATSTTGGAFQLQVTPVAPPNDDCGSPMPLLVGAPLPGSTAGALNTSAPSGCAKSDTRDVWFTFLAPLSGTYQFDTCSTLISPAIDTVVTVYPACDAPFIACSDNAAACRPGGSRAVVRVVANQKYLIRVAGVNGAEGSFALTANISPPMNDLCAAAQGVNEGTFPFDTLAATTDPAFIDLSCTAGFNLISNDVWFRYVPFATGPVSAGVCGSDFDTGIAVSLAVGGCPSGLYTVLACNDDFACNVGSSLLTPQSLVSWQAQAGVPYYIRVGSRIGAVGSGNLTIRGVDACRCDWNRSGALNIQDLFDFLASWFSFIGDYNNDTRSTVQDILDFMNCYFFPPSGCAGN